MISTMEIDVSFHLQTVSGSLRHLPCFNVAGAYRYRGRFQEPVKFFFIYLHTLVTWWSGAVTFTVALQVQ